MTVDEIRKNRIKWAEALRSGKYTQGFGLLKYYDSEGQTCHCAFGVACEVMSVPGQKSETGWWRYEGGSLFVAPSHVHAALGLDEHDSAYFVMLNDEDKLTFAEIATYIEALELPLANLEEGL